MLIFHSDYGPSHNFAILEQGRLVGDLDSRHAVSAASLNQLAIVHALEISDVTLGTEVTLEPSDIIRGSGRLQYFPYGFKLEAGDAANLTLSLGDHTAARALVRAIGGSGQVNELLRSDRSPLSDALVHTALKPLGDARDPGVQYNYGETTAYESALLLRQLLQTQAFAGSLQHGEFTGGLRADLQEVLSPYLSATTEHDLDIAKTGFRLSDQAYRALLTDLPPRTTFPNKQGIFADLRHDVGNIGRYTVAVLSTGHPAYQGGWEFEDQISYGAHRKIGSETCIAAGL